MAFEKEREILSEYIRRKNLKRSSQRQLILEVFLGTEQHLTAEDLYARVKKKNPSVGFATIYRSIRLFTEAGLCRELQVEGGVTLYEHLFNHQHHDHLICTACGQMIEVISPEIESLQEKLASKHKFKLTRHSLELYGTCSSCRK